jgi:antitoxin ParD1/3/4
MKAVARTIGFRPTEDDERIIRHAMREDERTADVIRRALRLLDREAWLARARADAERLADEDLSGEPDAW